MTRILFIGDIIGRPGRRCVETCLPLILEQFPADLIIANGENSAGGFGLSRKVADELFATGVDVLTLGNHAYDNKELETFIEDEEAIIRPANFVPTAPGKGWTVVTARNGVQVAVINLIGRVFMGQVDCPFREVDYILGSDDLPAIKFVDFHAEASSEKQAMAWHLDGRVSALVGTHTHVATADARILPGGTGYQTDAGMTGPHDSVIGMEAETALQRFLSHRSKAFSVARKNNWFNGVWMEFEENGSCKNIASVQLREDPAMMQSIRSAPVTGVAVASEDDNEE